MTAPLTTERPYAVYIQRRGQRPRRVDISIPDGKLPATLTVDGEAFYWTTADISARTLTYCDRKPD